MPAEAVALLSLSGHDVATVLQQDMGGNPDASVYAACLAEARALVTLDLDFADIRAYPPEDSQGILVIRLARQDTPSVIRALEHAIRRFETEAVEGRLWIVEADRVRIRGEDDTSFV